MNYDSDAKLNVEISQQRIEPCPAPTKIRSCCPHPNTHSWQRLPNSGQWPHPQLAPHHQSSMKRLDPSWRGGLARTLIRSLTGRSPKRNPHQTVLRQTAKLPGGLFPATGLFPGGGSRWHSSLSTDLLRTHARSPPPGPKDPAAPVVLVELRVGGQWPPPSVPPLQSSHRVPTSPSVNVGILSSAAAIELSQASY